MKLKEYLEKNRWKVTEFAKKLQINEGTLRTMIYQRRNPDLNIALRVETFTDGQVTCRDLLKEGELKEIEDKFAPEK